MAIVLHIDKLCTDGEAVVGVNYFSRNHSLDVKSFSHCLGILYFSLVMKDRGARQDLQIGQLRELVHQGFRDAVTEILHIGIRAGVNEGQDRYSSYLTTGREERERNSDDHEDYGGQRDRDEGSLVPFDEFRAATIQRVLPGDYRLALQMAADVLRDLLDRGVPPL